MNQYLGGKQQIYLVKFCSLQDNSRVNPHRAGAAPL
jgi:hypothetical protein